MSPYQSLRGAKHELLRVEQIKRKQKEFGKRLVSDDNDLLTKTWLDLSDNLPKSVISAVYNIEESTEKPGNRIKYTPGG